jgi:hypothetical protein
MGGNILISISQLYNSCEPRKGGPTSMCYILTSIDMEHGSDQNLNARRSRYNNFSQYFVEAKALFVHEHFSWSFSLVYT